MKIADIATLENGEWVVRGNHALADTLGIQDVVVRIIGGIAVYGTGRLAVSDTGRIDVSGSGRIDAPGWKEIARSGWALLRSPHGLYYAGCRAALTRDQALAYWNRTDERARIFTEAILAEQEASNAR